MLALWVLLITVIINIVISIAYTILYWEEGQDQSRRAERKKQSGRYLDVITVQMSCLETEVKAGLGI